jgi:hypothetical protein
MPSTSPERKQPVERRSPQAVILSRFAVILSRFAVILSEAKNLALPLRVNFAKHLLSP